MQYQVRIYFTTVACTSMHASGASTRAPSTKLCIVHICSAARPRPISEAAATDIPSDEVSVTEPVTLAAAPSYGAGGFGRKLA